MAKIIFTAVLLLAAGFCFADTFTNKDSGEVLTGYPTTKQNDDPITGQDNEKAPNAKETCDAACYDCLMSYGKTFC